MQIILNLQNTLKTNITIGTNSKFLIYISITDNCLWNKLVIFPRTPMTRILEVEPDNIKQLDERQLTDLLFRLLRLEARKHKIPISSISGTLNTKAKDGGEDACIKWSDGPEKTEWVPNRYTLFQCKATEMSSTRCSSEILQDVKTKSQKKKSKSQENELKPEIPELKPRVKHLFDNYGSYVLFCRDDYTSQAKLNRINAFREAIKSTGASYYDTADIQIYDANSISLWINDYVSLIIQVHCWLGRNLPNCMSTWEDWNKYPENNVDYISDDTLLDYISQLRGHFTGTKKVARIVGLSGLGKTRLALEVFRPSEDSSENIEFRAITDQVIYIDAADVSTSLHGTIRQWRDQRLEGILVVDNCELELHQRLKREIEHPDSRLSLLTLDYNPESNDDIYIIKLKRASDDVIKGIIRQSYPGLTDPDISRIVKFAEGFPKIAVMLAEARLNEVQDIGNLSNDILRDKLLWGRRPENETARKVIDSCSLFTHLGFSDDLANQRDFVAEKICNISKDDFYAHAVDFIEHGILDKRNRFVRVVPIPLAVRLAADWWKRCRLEKAKELLTGDNMPDGMAEALCDQISRLQHVNEARELTKELCGDSAPFGQAEVLNSEKGSRLFRSLVEVNPQASAEALEHVFKNYTKEELLNVGPGRRNLIWALEKLCFWEETFPIASRIMLSFAVSENEAWGNNATNQFLQLFHYLLSGTQAPPNVRLEVIDEALRSNDIDYKVLAVKALGHSLKSYHFCRSAGVECQGSRLPQEDWRPKLWSEVFDYWRGSLKRLIPLGCEDNELAKLARKQISDNIRGLVQHGLMDDIEAALTKICKENNIFWPEIYNEIEESIIYEGPNIPEEGLQRLYKWKEMLKPLSINERLRLVVSTPSHSFKKDENGHRVDLSENKAVLLAKECSEDISLLLEHLNLLFEGEQRNGYIFGYTLGESLDSPNTFVERSLLTMKMIKPSEVNPSVLGGFLSAIKPKFPELVEKTLDDISLDDTLYNHTVYLTRCIKPTQKDLKRIIELIKARKVQVNDLRMIGLSHESPEIVISFCGNLKQFGHEGLLSALEILFLYTMNKPEKFEACRGEIREILMTPGIICEFDRSSLMDEHYLSESLKIFLFEEHEDPELATHISNEIISACAENRNIYLLKRFLEPIIKDLLLKYTDITWPIFCEGLLSEDFILRSHIIGLFDSLNSYKDSNKGILSELPLDFLLEWCKNESEKAPLLIAKMMPIFMENNDSWSLHPLAKSLIDNYGDRSDVLLEINRNLGTFLWSGSAIPYYEKQIEVMEQLTDHNIYNVRKWAERNIKNLSKEIEDIKKKDEERDLGIF